MKKILILLIFCSIFFAGCGFNTKSANSSDVPQSFEEYQKKKPKLKRKQNKNSMNKTAANKNNSFDAQRANYGDGVKTIILSKSVEFGILLSEEGMEPFFTNLKGEKYSAGSNKRVVFYTPAPNDVTYEQMDDKMKFVYLIGNNLRNDNELKQFFIFKPYNYYVYTSVLKKFSGDEQKKMKTLGSEFNKVCSYFCVANPKTGTVYYYNDLSNMKSKTSQLKTTLLNLKNL